MTSDRRRAQTIGDRALVRPASSVAQLNVWVGRLFFWPGRALYIGRSADTGAHAHHAIQICVGLEEHCRLRFGSGSPWRRYTAAIIAADAVHELEGSQRLALLYVDPESDEGRNLASWTSNSAVAPVDAELLEAPRHRLHLCKAYTSTSDAKRLFDEVIEGLVTKPQVRQHDPRVTYALERLRRSGPVRCSLAEVAAEVSLSPGRFAHLFRADTGLPLRRYVLWLRLVEAARELARSRSVTEAAHAAGFADSAHLTRTFRRMFGVAPSAIVRGSRFESASSD